MINENLISQILDWSSDNNLFITLNSITNDKVKFEEQLRKISHKLNDFCYGRSYERKEKQLKIIGSIETGKINNILHAHLIVGFDSETRRPMASIDNYVRTHWSVLIGIENKFGSMIDIRPVGNINKRIEYMTKDTQYWLRNDFLNIIVL